jgi:hypothetical protein
MAVQDAFGLTLSGADEISLSLYETALRQLQRRSGDPIATVDAAIAASPQFTMAHVLKAYLHVLAADPDAIAIARTCHRTASCLPATHRERRHIEAIGSLIEQRRGLGAPVCEDGAIDTAPRARAPRSEHQGEGFGGASHALRDRIARGVPSWDRGAPAYHAVLGLHAFLPL